MKKIKSMICFTLIILLLLQYEGLVTAFAAVYPTQPAPEKLRVEAISDTEPAIGNNEYDGYYADIKSDAITPPTGVPSSPNIYLNYYLQEVNKPYNTAEAVSLKEGGLSANTSSENVLRLKDLSSGTVYYTYSKAYYTFTQDSTTYTSSESAASNTVKFMTDIAIEAYPYGPKQIKIVWDDVWNSGQRIDYKLYISENASFTNTQPIYIGQEQIGEDKAVTVNQANGELEYIHTVSDSGRVYYIKIAPDLTETELKRSAESDTVTVSSYILAATTKMSDTDTGAIWKLVWSPVVTGLADSTIKVSYQIYKGTGTSGGIEQYMASVDDTAFFLTVETGDESSYYIIKAIVTKDGEEVYPGIKIQSQKIYVKESEVPTTPGVPELVAEFQNAGSTIISFDDQLTATSADILWRAPLTGDGEVDTDVSYDIWLITDPNILDDPPSGALIASSVKMNESNFVMSGTKLLGYKYSLNDLVPNSTYYFKIVAKKNYTQFVDNVLTSVTMQSLPAMKVIITPTLGQIDQPLVPATPPFALKLDSDGKDMVSTTTAVVTLQNKWYEQYTIIDGSTYEWIYRTPEQIEATSPGAVTMIEDGTADPLKFRKVEYDSGVTIDVGCAEYSSDMDYTTLEELSTDKIIGFPVTPNDSSEDITAEGAIPDGLKHNIDITVGGLEPNKTYIIWIKAARRSVDLISGPSDPIIVTTVPDLDETIETPTVPVFNYYDAADTYIDLAWNFNSQYTYNLEYGLADDRDSATGSLVITSDDFVNESYYRVTGLDPDTQYYFWIQAEISNSSGEAKQSEFSDSYMVKTLEDIPPSTPKSFGVKSTTKSTITYEWIKEDGIEYILEIANDIDYTNSRKYEAGSVSGYTVEDLRSNYRYYARLYAYDPTKELTSEPTQSVTVRTLRSTDDYDSNEDVEDVIGGDFIVKDSSAVGGVWTVSITGANADRFIQHVQTDKVLDYCINLKTMPAGTTEISVIISQRVFYALGQQGENLLLKTVMNTLVIRPGMLASSDGSYGSAESEANFVFDITLKSTTDGSNIKNLIFKSTATTLAIGISDGNITPVEKLEKPLKVLYEYNSASWYKQGVTAGYTLASGSTAWKRSETSGSYDTDSGLGILSFETYVPGRLAVAEQGTNYYDDISKSYAKKSIANVASVHELKTITGRKFEPDKYLTISDGAKFMLDMLDVNYGSNYMTLAIKSGIVQSGDSSKPAINCTREKLIAMAVRVCELKTSQKAKATVDDTGIYKDIAQASASLLPKIRFAQENGVITSRFSDTLGPKDPITRAEAMVLLEKLLRYAGEL